MEHIKLNLIKTSCRRKNVNKTGEFPFQELKCDAMVFQKKRCHPKNQNSCVRFSSDHSVCRLYFL